MSFQLLASHLHQTAEEAKAYFTQQHGAKNWQYETALPKIGSLKPTMQAELSGGGILCVEVSERAFSPTLDAFVIECCTKGYPVKLYVALPDTPADRDFAKNLKEAKVRGIGVVEIQGEESTILAEAVSLSLFGVRSIDLKRLPESVRDAARQAEATFKNGNPVKGCQSLCEELEAVTRAFAAESRTLGWWKSVPPGTKENALNLQTGAWAKVLERLRVRLDYQVSRKKCPGVTTSLIGKAQVLTDPRNSTSHKPKDLSEIIERDRKLRTLFEQSADTLIEWVTAAKAVLP